MITEWAKTYTFVAMVTVWLQNRQHFVFPANDPQPSINILMFSKTCHISLFAALFPQGCESLGRQHQVPCSQLKDSKNK